MAISQGLIDTYWRRYNQRRALTGLPSSYQEMRGTLDPMLEYAAKEKADESRIKRDYDLRNRQLNLQAQAQEDASRAATVSGIAQTGGLLAQGGLTYKALQNQSANTDLMKQYLLGKSAPAGVSPGVGSGGGILASGVGSGAGVPMASAAPYSGAGPALSYGAGGEVGGGLGSGAAITGEAGAAAPGAMGGVSLPGLGLAAGAFGAQVALGKAVQPWANEHGLKYTAKYGTYAGLPGAVTGATVDAVKAIGSWAEDAWGHIF